MLPTYVAEYVRHQVLYHLQSTFEFRAVAMACASKGDIQALRAVRGGTLPHHTTHFEEPVAWAPEGNWADWLGSGQTCIASCLAEKETFHAHP